MTDMLDCFPLKIYLHDFLFHQEPFIKDVKYIIFAASIIPSSAERNLLYYDEKPQEPRDSL